MHSYYPHHILTCLPSPSDSQKFPFQVHDFEDSLSLTRDFVCSLKFGTIHCCLLDSPLGTQLKNMIVYSPESNNSQDFREAYSSMRPSSSHIDIERSSSVQENSGSHNYCKITIAMVMPYSEDTFQISMFSGTHIHYASFSVMFSEPLSE